MAFEFKTQRLFLRPAGAHDVDTLHRLWSDEGVRKYLLDDIVIPRETAQAFVDESLALLEERGLGQWMVYEPDETTLVGFCGLKPLDEDGAEDEVELLYGIYPAYWGKGLTVEASRALLRHAFETVGLDYVVAETDMPNVNSVRVMEKLGMVDDGIHDRQSGPNRRFLIRASQFHGAP